MEDQPNLDTPTLQKNMEDHGLKAGELVKIILQNEFSPTDILNAFAAPEYVNHCVEAPVDELYGLAKEGREINQFLLHAGLKPLQGDHNAKLWPLKFDDFRPFRSMQNETPDKPKKQWVFNGLSESSSNEESHIDNPFSRGHLLHYIPSHGLTRQKLSGGESSLRKLYLEPTATKPPTTPNRSDYFSSDSGYNKPGAGFNFSHPSQSESEAKYWVSPIAQTNPGKIPKTLSIDAMGKANRIQYRGKHYMEHFEDHRWGNGQKGPDGKEPGLQFRKLGDEYMQGEALGRKKGVSFKSSESSDDSDDERERRARDLSVIDKMASAYRGRTRGKRSRSRSRLRSGSRSSSRSANVRQPQRNNSPDTLIRGLSVLLESTEAFTHPIPQPQAQATKGKMKVGHVYTQSILLQKKSNDLNDSLQVGKPIQVTQHKVRTTFHN
jgi:hypothetical protein